MKQADLKALPPLYISRNTWQNKLLVSDGIDSSSTNRHLRAKMVSEQSIIVKMRRSPDKHYPALPTT